MLVFIIIIIILYYVYNKIYDSYYHYDFACVHKVKNMTIFEPKNIDELINFLKNNKKNISIAGSKYSHGGNTLIEDGVQIDMSNFNNIIYDKETTLVEVEAGTIWKDVILHLAKYNRTVSEMQSYYNFSVGGSVSVNCHGRGVKYGSISDTILSISVITSNGQIINCDFKNNADLFDGIIGGYGLIGIIYKVIFITEPNDKLCLKINKYSLDELPILINKIINNKRLVFWNANLYPSSKNLLYSYEWEKTKKNLTNKTISEPMFSFYPSKMFFEQLLRRIPIFKNIRATLEPYLYEKYTKNEVFYRSYVTAENAVSLSVLSKHPTTTVLQEYFIPIDHIYDTLNKMIPYFEQINCLNISLRYVKKITRSKLNYAPVDSISIVIYFNIWNNESYMSYLKFWTNEMIKITLSVDGKFYLPYLLVYNPKDIHKMYPNFEEIEKLKKIYDPDTKIKNLMYNHLTEK